MGRGYKGFLRSEQAMGLPACVSIFKMSRARGESAGVDCQDLEGGCSE